jgi:hypothetical protein
MDDTFNFVLLIVLGQTVPETIISKYFGRTLDAAISV